MGYIYERWAGGCTERGLGKDNVSFSSVVLKAHLIFSIRPLLSPW